MVDLDLLILTELGGGKFQLWSFARGVGGVDGGRDLKE
jgi:hypothetical protein